MKTKSSSERAFDTYIGIDPGDRWIGYAQLDVSPGPTFQASCSVIDAEARSLASIINELMPLKAGACVAVESYQQRPVGHQSWGSGETLQLIGALRYVCEIRGHHFVTVNPGDADFELPKLVLGAYVERWAQRWPKPDDERWRHARSAWRVVARYLLSTHTSLLETLRVKTPMVATSPLRRRATGDDLYAPNSTWVRL